MKRKVCVLTAVFPSSTDPGRGSHIEVLTKVLSEYEDVYVITPRIYDQCHLYEAKDSYPLFRFAFWSENKLLKDYKRIPVFRVLTYIISGIKTLSKVVKKNQCEVILVHWLVPTGLIAALANIVLRKKLVIMIHGSDLNNYAQRNKLFTCLCRWILKKSDAIMAVSSSLVDKVKQVCPEVRFVQEVCCGVNIQDIEKAQAGIVYSRLPVTKDQKVILYIGDMRKEKGVLDLLTVTSKMKHKKNELAFVFIGQGDLADLIQQKIADEQLYSYVFYVGAVSHQEVFCWLRDAYSVVLPSYSEGKPVVLMEALSCGVPVIASSVGGIPEFVKDEENGLLIEPGDTEGLLNQLNRILDAQLYLKLKEAVKQQRTEFSADKQAQRIKDVIDFCFKGSE